MAITFAAIWNTPYASAFLATHDGAGGDTANITNAVLAGNTVAGTPIANDVAAALADQAAARAFTGHTASICVIETQPASTAGATCSWAVDANVAANLLILSAYAIGASTCVIVLRHRHTTGR
jgi:hypothetical protein